MKRSQPEFLLSCAVADALRWGAYPDVVWTHFPAGERRPTRIIKGKRVSMAGERLKRMGTIPGVADYLFWPPQGRPAFLELKSATGTLNDNQKAFRDRVVANGYRYAVARTLDEAVQILCSWGILERVRAVA